MSEPTIQCDACGGTGTQSAGHGSLDFLGGAETWEHCWKCKGMGRLPATATPPPGSGGSAPAPAPTAAEAVNADVGSSQRLAGCCPGPDLCQGNVAALRARLTAQAERLATAERERDEANEARDNARADKEATFEAMSRLQPEWDEAHRESAALRRRAESAEAALATRTAEEKLVLVLDPMHVDVLDRWLASLEPFQVPTEVARAVFAMIASWRSHRDARPGPRSRRRPAERRPPVGEPKCEFCEDGDVFMLRARCHPTAPLRAERSGNLLTLTCYVPECSRVVAHLQLAPTPAGSPKEA